MACINKNLPGYKELKAYFGDSLTNSLIRNNAMAIPTVEDASRMIKGNKVLQFKKALNYLRSTTSASTDNLLAVMPRILQKKGSDIYVLKGSRLSEQPSPGAKINVEEANISFLKKVNDAFGPIFRIEKDYGLTKAQIAEINSFSKELLDEGVGIVNLYADMLKADPVEFFKFVSQQAQNLDANDNVNKNLDSTQSTLDSFGETIVNFAKELFPAKVGTTGLSMITGKEPVSAGQALPTRFQSGTTVGFVEESLKVARDSNNTIGSPYLTNAIYYAEGKVKGPPSIPNNVVLPYSNKKLADQLNKLKEQFRAIPASSVKDKVKREALKNKIFSIADTVYDEFKAALKNNIRSIYEAWDSTLINRSKHWYDGANRIAQNFANTYGLSLEASSATIAVLSPQNEWFNNISAAYRVMDIMKSEADTKVTADMFEQALAQSRDEPFSIVIDALKNKYVGNSINDILSEIDENAQDVNSKALQDIVASMLRVVDLAVHNRDVSVVLPEGLVSGIKQSGGTNAKFAWGSSGEIYKAISIFKNQNIENISTRLGKGNKVRNFYNNIANPNSKNGEVTVDTHAAGAGLLNVVGSDDTASMGLFRNDSVGNSPFYIVLKESYQEVAKEKGLLPRELQSVTWEATRLLINESSKTSENRDFINNIWKQVQEKKLTQNAAIKTIIGNFEFGRPEWVRSTDPGTDQTGLSETGPAVQQGQLNASDLRGQRPGESGQGATGVVTGHVGIFGEVNPETKSLSDKYKKDKGITTPVGDNITMINSEYGKRIADAYMAMKNEPENPEVKQAYKLFADETIDQYNVMLDAGYKIEVFTGEGEPYSTAKAMVEDTRDNKRMYILSTEKYYGPVAITKQQRKENPFLQDSGYKDVNGTSLLINDVFRAVHDFFGHTERGNGFGPIGEENAWDVHARMYTDIARRAMTVETRGHTSMIEFGLHARDEKGNITREITSFDTPLETPVYPVAKIGLLPKEFSEVRKSSFVENKTGKTQGFFSDVVTGKSNEFKPVKEWQSIITFTPDEETFKQTFDTFKGNFDQHIATSIPTFRETQIKVGSALVKMYPQGGLIYDIGGSEGGFIKAITKESGGKIKSINLDVNEDMKAAHEKTAVPGSEFVNEAFLEPYTEEYLQKLKDTKVVGSEGKPLRVFHGTIKEFEKFDPTAEATNRKSENIGGIYFHSDARYAKNYAQSPGFVDGKPAKGPKIKGKVIGAYLNMKNPLNTTEDIKKYRKQKMSFQDAKNKALEKLDKSIHDGVIFEGNESNPAEYVVFSDDQIIRPKTYPRHVPSEKADVVHESMVFQFISPERAQFIKEIKDNYIKPDGIVLLEEKIVPDSEKVWAANETKKNQYKGNYYSQEAITQKAEQVLVGMKANQTSESDLFSVLSENFDVVEPYWNAGNFKGYIASNSQEKVDEFLENLGGEITSDYSSGNINDAAKVAPGTFKITIDEQKLTDLVEENKKNPTEVPFEDNIPDEQYQKSSYSEGYWRSEQEKRFAVENIVRMLSKKFNIPFEYENDASLPWAAKFSNGKIVLNLAKIGADSAFHEIAHPFVEMLKTENPELYNSLITELKSSEEGQKEIERVEKEYPELSPQEQLDEALVSLIGKNSSNQFLNSAETSPKKSLIQRFWDWVKDIFFNMGIDASTFSPTMSINDVASMISNPMFSIDLSRLVDLSNRDEYYQKKATQQMQRDFDALINDTISKLKADVNIVGKTEEENKRKYFSSKQVEDLINDKKDINALNSFITSGLFNLKDVNDRFNEFITKYEAKGTKSKEDLRNLSLLLNEIEDNITLYGNAGPLLESIFEMFPDEKDNFSDWAYSLKREKRLMNEYQSWGVNVVADWLFPYHKKAVRQALASNNLYSVVSKEVYDNEVKLAAEEGITDKGAILDRAIKQEIRNTLLIAKRDASGITGYLAGVLNSRDSIASTVGQAVMDELHKALTYGQSVETKFKKLMKQYRGSSVFSSNAVEKEFYQKYLRKVKVWTYQGLGVDAKPKYEYKEHTAFHEEYEWDNFYNAKREFFDKLGPVPSKTDLAAYRKYKAARDGWFAQNTIITKDQNGKDARIPSPKYKNAQFGVLQNDPLFKEMYNTYKLSNNKLGKQGLRYGIVPQLSNAVVDVKGFKPKNALEGIRHWIGEQEQVYFVQSISGGEKPVVPINHVRLLDEKDLSYNLINSVSKFAASSAKYESMSMLEPQVQILKNFIGGNNALNIKKRRTIKRSASGIKALSRIIHDDMYVDSTKLNNQLDSFLNDAVYGQSMKKEVVQMWDSKFEVFKTNDKSVNGGPRVETLHGFENVREFTGLHDLDYSGFEFGKDRNVGEWTIKMTKKDWNFSVKKTADRLGLLTALQTMIVNPISATVNIIRGKSEVFVESLGGRYYNMKDYAFGEKEYWKAIGSGDFFEDLKGGKPSFLSSMLIDYDALQGELIDASGRTLERGLVNKFFRTRRLFFAQNGGEHYIQTQLMIAMMNHQKIKTTGGETLSLFEARKREFDGKLKMSDTNWTDDNNREFRETLNEVNTRLNGNYNKTDKAMIQRTWWGSAIMMFRKHIYNGLANRYRKGYVNYQTGNYTEGYWRQFAHGLVREIGEMARDRTIRKFNLNEQEKYAFKKFGGDIAMLMLFIAAFKMFDDDDDDNEFTDSATLIFRRLVSESGQYTPIIAPLEAGKIAKNPSAISHTINNFYEAFKQTLADPTEEYERNGPGYEDGDNKAWKKWQRAIPGWRIVLNTSEPERLLQFYQQNSLGFLKPSAGKENEEETGNK